MASRLLGRFNVANWLAATDRRAGARRDARPRRRRRPPISPPVPGRMERVDRGQPFLVVVDFAHTPQALENALRTLRPHTEGRLMVVFGHAGERDPASRPIDGRDRRRARGLRRHQHGRPARTKTRSRSPRSIAAGRSSGRQGARSRFRDRVDRASAIRTLIGAPARRHDPAGRQRPRAADAGRATNGAPGTIVWKPSARWPRPAGTPRHEDDLTPQPPLRRGRGGDEYLPPPLRAGEGAGGGVERALGLCYTRTAGCPEGWGRRPLMRGSVLFPQVEEWRRDAGRAGGSGRRRAAI